VVTISELLQGVHRAEPSRRSMRHAAVERVLTAFEAIPITSAVARVHAYIWADLGRGEAVPAHDLWIGATALAYGLGVATLDARHFARIPDLRVVAP
jgi:tRNA(fMet)-specific endonuclease VapC